MNPIAALLFFITVVNLLLGTLVFFRNHKNPLYVSLAGFIFLVAGWMLSMGGFYQVESIDNSFFWIRATYIFGIVIANTLVYFSLVFPNGSQVSLSQKILVYLPALPLIGAIVFMPNFLFKEIVFHQWWKDVKLGLVEYTIYTIYFVTVYFGAIAILFKKFFSFTGRLRTQIAYVLNAVFIAGSFGAIFDLLYPWLNLYKYIWLGPIGTLIMVGIFVYAIVKHRLLDIRLVVARAVAYAVLIGIIGVVYSGVTFIIGEYLLGFSLVQNRLIVYPVLTVIIALSFNHFRNLLEDLSDKVFFKGHYKTDVLLSELGNIMSTTIDLKILTQQILTKLFVELRVVKSCFVLVDKGALYNITSIGYKGSCNYTYEQLEPLFAQTKTVVFDELPENDLKGWLRSLDISLSRSLVVKGNCGGLLILGEKSSGELYSDQDIKLLDILAPEVAVAFENAKSFDKIKRFNVTLTEEVNKATKDLKLTNQKLQNLDKLKDDFVSVASHELRTPMTAIRSYAWMALNRPDVSLSEKLRKYLSKTLISTERLIALVDDMLNISRIESGRVAISPVIFDIYNLTKDVFEEVLEKAKEKNIQLEMEQERVPKVFADPDKVHQVMLNLIGNSLKFALEGGKIKVSFFSDGNTVETSISDNGVGISADDIPRLFKKFARLDNSYISSSSTSGTGLGLYICKNLVELMHGKIWVHSDGVGKGATFSFSLPVANSEVISEAEKYFVRPKNQIKALERVAI